MLTQLERPAPAQDRGVTCRLRLDVHDGPDVLVRVLTTLRRRRCEITHVDYLARDRHHPGRMVIGIEAPPNHAHCVEAWLANLVDVVCVSTQ
jgi:acetolactate synthase small subunit